MSICDKENLANYMPKPLKENVATKKGLKIISKDKAPKKQLPSKEIEGLRITISQQQKEITQLQAKLKASKLKSKAHKQELAMCRVALQAAQCEQEARLNSYDDVYIDEPTAPEALEAHSFEGFEVESQFTYRDLEFGFCVNELLQLSF